MRRQWLVYVCCFCAIGYTYWTGHQATSRINDERARNSTRACERQNQQNAALIGFIVQSIPPEKVKDPRVVGYVARAEKTWPQTDCAVQVKEQVSK